MKDKYSLSDLLVSFGVGLIFGYASHMWYSGLIVGICYFITVTLINRKRKK